MHFLQTIIIALMAGSATAFTLPGGLEDGLYRAYYDKEGREVHEPLVNVTTTAPDRRHTARQPEAPSLDPLDKRQADYNIYCGCGYNLDHGDCDAAVSDLSNQFGGYDGSPCVWIQADMSYYSIRGSVVAFGCNPGYLGGIVQVCGQDYGDDLKVITSQCGAYVAGTFSPVLEGISERKTYIDLGYMQYYAGLDFCGNAESSPVSSC